MAKHKPTSLVASRLGNHRRRSDFLGEGAFPGLTIDNLSTTPIGSGSGSVGSQIAALRPQLAAMNQLQQNEAQADADALVQHSTSSSSGTSSLGVTLGSIASGLLGGGLGVSSILESLAGLFSGGGQTAQALTPYSMPSSINYAAGLNGPGTTPVAVDYGQGGQVRSLVQTDASPGGGASTQTSPTVHVNVSAMDSQSFLDHSDDIANAVRTAMLNSHPINDVISSL